MIPLQLFSPFLLFNGITTGGQDKQSLFQVKCWIRSVMIKTIVIEG